MGKKHFIITIDTEGDNQWDVNHGISTENAKYLPRFQELCGKYGFYPTWLTNYEMVQDPFFVGYMREQLQEDACEIGMHLHAWNNPPEYPLARITKQRDYLIEYPEFIMEEKIKTLTAALEDTFSRKMTSHRSGRWALDQRYTRLLVKYGYLVDASVTPHANWTGCEGATGLPGSNYKDHPEHPYYIEENLLEVPMSIRPIRGFFPDGIHGPKDFLREVKGTIKPRNLWIRPDKKLSVQSMKAVVDQVSKDSDYAMFMIHSSELMPGGSATFPDRKSMDKAYDTMEALFDYIRSSGEFEGAALTAYAQQFAIKAQR